mmetsp:Transcript_4771/g.6132  ORF Transcript_4771/g.6132 Transcript_4771/m.6132 type:complete len:417 (+) Transcript_4771:13-1263(+)
MAYRYTGLIINNIMQLEKADQFRNNPRQIQPSSFYQTLAPNISGQSMHHLKSNGFAVIDGLLSEEDISMIRTQCLNEKYHLFKKTVRSLMFIKCTLFLVQKIPQINFCCVVFLYFLLYIFCFVCCVQTQALTTRTDKICWLHENDSLPDSLVNIIILLKSFASELENSKISNDWINLEVPQRVMASMYRHKHDHVENIIKTKSDDNNNAAEEKEVTSSAPTSPLTLKVSETVSSQNKISSQPLSSSGSKRVGYVAHRDHCPPEDDDLFWCWKSDREQSERFLTAILYVNDQQWSPSSLQTSNEKDNISSSSSSSDHIKSDSVNKDRFGNDQKDPFNNYHSKSKLGGELRLYPQALSSDHSSEHVRKLEEQGKYIDIEPIGGRLVLFDSRKMLHAVLPITDETAPIRLAFSCWILKK